jgi:hypothetical protein
VGEGRNEEMLEEGRLTNDKLRRLKRSESQLEKVWCKETVDLLGREKGCNATILYPYREVLSVTSGGE